MEYIVNYTDTFDGTSWDDSDVFDSIEAARERAELNTQLSGPMLTARVFPADKRGPSLYTAGSF